MSGEMRIKATLCIYCGAAIVHSGVEMDEAGLLAIQQAMEAHDLQCERNPLVKHIAEVERERDEARDFGERAAKAHNDLLLNGPVTACAWCGHEFESGTPIAQSDVLYEHARVCEKHPLRAAESGLAALREQVRTLRETLEIADEELHHIIMVCGEPHGTDGVAVRGHIHDALAATARPVEGPIMGDTVLVSPLSVQARVLREALEATPCFSTVSANSGDPCFLSSIGEACIRCTALAAAAQHETVRHRISESELEEDHPR